MESKRLERACLRAAEQIVDPVHIRTGSIRYPDACAERARRVAEVMQIIEAEIEPLFDPA